MYEDELPNEEEEAAFEKMVADDANPKLWNGPFLAVVLIGVVFWAGLIGYSQWKLHSSKQSYEALSAWFGEPEWKQVSALRNGGKLSVSGSTSPKVLIVCTRADGMEMPHRSKRRIDPLQQQLAADLRAAKLEEVSHVLFLAFGRTFISQYNFAFEKGYQETCEAKLIAAQTGKVVAQATLRGGLPPKEFLGSKGSEVFGEPCDADVLSFVRSELP